MLEGLKINSQESVKYAKRAHDRTVGNGIVCFHDTN